MADGSDRGERFPGAFQSDMRDEREKAHDNGPTLKAINVVLSRSVAGNLVAD